MHFKSCVMRKKKKLFFIVNSMKDFVITKLVEHGTELDSEFLIQVPCIWLYPGVLKVFFVVLCFLGVTLIR